MIMFMHLYHVNLLINVAVTFVPLVITVGAKMRKPIVVDEKIEIRDIINVTLTLDHRYTDGANATILYKRFIEYLKNPDLCDK